MAENSKIQWTDHTWNPWTGCKKVSAGCKFCYMYRDQERYGKAPEQMVLVKQATVNKVFRNASAGDKIFVCSWSDFFIDSADQWRDAAWALIKSKPELTFQILTKRPERIMECLPADWGEGYDNVWLGVSVESMEVIDRAYLLAKLPAKTRFISAEPLLGAVDFVDLFLDEYKKINWVIVGGESGNDNGKYKYRESKVKWYRDIVTTCRLHHVPVFVKQLGTHVAKKYDLKHRHGGDISEFPKDLKFRQFPV